MDHQRFVSYYTSQAGHGLPGFQGAPVQYGRGIGSVLSRAFRFILPFIKRGATLAKPHLSTAAKGIASDVVSAVTTRLMKGSESKQEGSGILRLSRRKRKRSVAALPLEGHKNPKRRKIASHSKRKTRRGPGKRHGLGENIF